MEAAEFTQHRKSLCKVFISQGIKSGIIAYKSPIQPEEKYTGSHLPFHQEGLFYWISGWANPDSCIVIDVATSKSTLYIPKYDDTYQIWTGPIPSTEYIKSTTGVDNIRVIDDLVTDISTIRPIFTVPNQFENADPEQFSLLSASGIARRFKSRSEIDTLRHASRATSDALLFAMKSVHPGINESDVEAAFGFEGSRNGCKYVSFPTIACAGQNAAYLHYMANSAQLNDGDLILVDCGLFYNHYAGDVTRTFPINGHFSEDQKRVYNLLLQLQKQLIDLVHPGINFDEMNLMMFRGIFEIVRKLGIVPSDSDYLKSVAHLFCPHLLSHHVGCNVHDLVFACGEGSMIQDSADASETLAPNMVITIEPGIYFNAARLEKSRAKPKYSAVDFDKALFYARAVGGIRIEDDVLVTEGDPEVLSTCPKTVEEIERQMAGK